MRSINVPNQNNGFTLLELLVVLSMAGLLSAITAPSLFGLYARTQLKTAVSQVQGAFQEGQQQAIKSSKTCTLTLDGTNHQITGDCLLTGNRQLTDVSMRSSLSAFQFNLKGITVDSSKAPLTQPLTVVIASSKTGEQSCLVFSTPLGLMRTGTYSGTDTVDSKCQP